MPVRSFSLPLACSAMLVSVACGGAAAQSAGATEPPCDVSAKHVAQPDEPFRTLGAAELHAAQQQPVPPFVFDVNRRERYDKGHVPSAVWLAKDEVKAERLPADRSARVVFYCSSPT